MPDPDPDAAHPGHDGGGEAGRLEAGDVHKALITPLRERWKVDVEDGDDIDVKGNIVDHEYSLEIDGRKVAEVSKRWFRVRDTYGVQVNDQISPILALAIAVALDTMTGLRD